MKNKLNMQDIIGFLVAKNNMSKDEAERFVGALFSLVEKGLIDDGLSEIEGFGTLKCDQKNECDAIDKSSDEKIDNQDMHLVSFTPNERLRSLVNKPFSHFEVTVLNEGVFIDGIPHNNSSNSIKDDKDEEVRSINEKHESKQAECKPVDNSNLIAKAAENAKKEKDRLFTAPIVERIDTEESDKTSSVADEIEKKEQPTNKDSLIEQTEAFLPNKSKPKNNLKLLWYTLGSVIVILLFFSANFIYKSYLIDKPSELALKINEPPEPVNEIADETDNIYVESEKAVGVIDSVQVANLTPRKTAKISPGITLRLIALNKLGSKEFWVYIYLINKDKIENPNVVPIGLILDLPHQSEYPLDANNPEDVAKAKQLGDEIMKSSDDL